MSIKELVVKNLSKGQISDMFKQMEELFLKVDKLSNDLKNQKNQHDKEIKKLKKEHKKELQHINFKMIEKDKKLEVERLKNQNKKDSSNSGKPSGTNGFKQVITNRREKSNNKQGGQKRTYRKMKMVIIISPKSIRNTLYMEII